MTREEDYTISDKWWQEHAEKFYVDCLQVEGALKNYERGYEDAIDKACDLLYEYNRKQSDKMFGTVHTADVTINVAQFRKAMKGGKL